MLLIYKWWYATLKKKNKWKLKFYRQQLWQRFESTIQVSDPTIAAWISFTPFYRNYLKQRPVKSSYMSKSYCKKIIIYSASITFTKNLLHLPSAYSCWQGMYLAKALWFRACVWIQLIMGHLWDKNWIISVKIGYELRYCFVLLRLFCCRTQRCINTAFSEMWIIIISTFLLLSLWTLFSLVHSWHAP